MKRGLRSEIRFRRFEINEDSQSRSLTRMRLSVPNLRFSIASFRGPFGLLLAEILGA